MTDHNSQFFAILTAIGEAKQANADALGIPWNITQMGVGDADGSEPIPDRLQTTLINEQRRAPLNQLKVDPENASIIIAEQVIPPDVGGWWIREIGLYDADNDLVAVANCAPSFKPLLNQGTGKTQVVRLNIIVTSSANVELKIDPAVVLATREYVDNLVLTVLPPDKAPGTFTQVRINDRGVVQEGFNPNTLAGFGIEDAYTASETDALLDQKLDTTGGLLTGVVTIQADQNTQKPGLRIVNYATDDAQVLLKLETPKTAVYLAHRGGTRGAELLNAAGEFTDLDLATLNANAVKSAGSTCHTEASYLKPIQGRWIAMAGVTVLPLGGTWACFMTSYINGLAINCETVILAGGMSLGSQGMLGVAWRFQ